MSTSWRPDRLRLRWSSVRCDQLVEVHVIYDEDFAALLDEEQLLRLVFLRRADEVRWVIPAFKLFELVGRR